MRLAKFEVDSDIIPALSKCGNISNWGYYL